MSALRVAALCVASLTALTGCWSNPGDRGSDSELLQGLGALDIANHADPVTYVDVAEVRGLSKDDSKRFALIGLPGSSLVNSPMPAPWGQHLKVTQIDTAVDTAEAGHWAGSFDAAAITKSLKSKGYTQREEAGSQVWTPTDSSKTSFQISVDEVSYSSRDGGALSDVNPKEGASLADNEYYQRAAECLGDVYRADFSAMTSTKPVRLSVLGQQAASAAKNTEILCFVAKDEATADRLAAKLRSAVHTESPDFDGTEVTVKKGDRPYVRATVPDSATQRPGRLLTSDIELWMAMHDL